METGMPVQSTQGAVAVAVSGGADSLFCLVTLLEAGLPVMAVHGAFIPESVPGLEHERTDAGAEKLAALCYGLGVPFFHLDCRQAFLNTVIAPFVRGYAQGRTPNPCVSCNAAVKFGLLREKAMALGATALATGHYARVLYGGAQFPFDPPGSEAPLLSDPGAAATETVPALLEGADPLKDQSYFLCLVPLSALEKTLLPLGRFSKAEVLRLLAEKGLDAPVPGESQEVCFVPGDEYRDFLPRMAETLGVPLPGPGPMLLADGQRLGSHGGLWRYTEGQRRGLGIGWKEPLHVIAKEESGNVLRLGPKAELETAECLCGEVNVLLPVEYWPERVLVKTRYRERAREARVRVVEGPDGRARMEVRFVDPVPGVAPGQAAAVYVAVPGLFHADGRPWLRVVGGGVIEAARV